MLISAGAATSDARAADAPLKKALPVQFVKVCDMYGPGFFQLPGTTFCAAFRGQLQVDTNYEAGRDAVRARICGAEARALLAIALNMAGRNVEARAVCRGLADGRDGPAKKVALGLLKAEMVDA